MKLQSKKSKRIVVIGIIAAIIAVLALTIGVIWLVANNTPDLQLDEKEIIDAVISSYPDKTIYYVGETFDATGIKMEALARNEAYNQYIEHDRLTFSGFDSSVPNDALTITVTYQGVTKTFTVKIIAKPSENPTLVDIEICDFKTSYTMAEWNRSGPSVVGATVKCIYSDESIIDSIPLKTKWIYGAVTVDAPCTLDLTIKYNDNGTIVEKVVTITITN